MKLTGAKWTILGEVTRAGLGALSFFLLARALGATEYGVVAATATLVAIGLPVLSIGTMWLTQSDPKSSLLERSSAHLTLGLLVMTPASLIVALIAALTLDLPLAAAAALAWGELVPLWFVSTVAGSHLGAGQRFGYFAWFTAAVVTRLVASITTYFWFPSVAGWAGSLAVCGGAMVLIACVILRCEPSISALRDWYRTRWRQGLSFSSVGTSTTLIDTGDQYLMASVLNSTATGHYSLAWRLASYTLIPVRGICVRAFPEYFRYAEQGDYAGLTALLRRTAWIATAFGIGAASFVLGIGLVVVPILLPDFERSLAPLVVLLVPMVMRAWHYSLGDSLYALKATRSRLLAVWGAAVISLPMSVAAMLEWGMMGAAYAAVATEFVAIALLAAAVARALRHSKDTEQGSSSGSGE